MNTINKSLCGRPIGITGWPALFYEIAKNINNFLQMSEKDLIFAKCKSDSNGCRSFALPRQ